VTPLDGKSFTDSEKSLAKPGNEEKFSSESSTADEESQDKSDIENGESSHLEIPEIPCTDIS
jgi:hypothetical protein